MKYVPLHSHSDASISDGMFSARKWSDAFKEFGFAASALTDHGTMSNIIPFHKAMKEKGQTLIVGCEFYFVDNPLDKSATNRKNSHLILLAKNYDGFQNLLKLMKLAWTDGFYYKSRIGFEWLKAHSENLVCLTACQGGVLSNQVWRESKGETCDGLEMKYLQLLSIFGNDLYVEFQGHYTPQYDEKTKELFCSQTLINEALYGIRKRVGFQQIVTNDSHYILPEHAKIQKMLRDMAYGRTDTGESATSTKDHFCDSLWLKNHFQVYEAFRKNHEYLPKQFVADGIRNTVAVFEKCKDFEFPKGKRYIPKFKAEIDSRKFFKKLVLEKFTEFCKSGDLFASKKIYLDRLAKEYNVIAKYNLEDYFLIVWDLIEFAKKNDIPTGLGRGSAAGCLISYLLGIVKVDPIEHKLIFERFLNANRCETGELPDIDTDFSSKHRATIKKYVLDTYGQDKVCEIGTYGRMKLKTAILDFGKAFNIGTSRELLNITTQLDMDKDSPDDLLSAAEQDPKLKKLLIENPDYTFCIEECIGQIKSQGVHPAGLIICSEDVATVTPIKTQVKKKKDETDVVGEAEKRIIMTQTEDKHVIAQGLMKVDILGVKEYDIIKYVIDNSDCSFTLDNYVQEIMRLERKEPNAKVWKMFQEGRTECVFQFSSSGMQELMVGIKPDVINDLIAANALYRPACLENGWHILYCNRKHGLDEVEFVHKDVEESLQDTYGVIVYQEQFMEVIHKLGGISLVESDIIRSALGKKDKEKLAKFKDKFIEGASKKIAVDDAEHLWEQIEKAAGYSFNKSHSASYAILAYISQYFKITYPAPFWCANLYWSVIKKDGEASTIRQRSMEMGVVHRLPHINKSKAEFYNNDKKIVWGFISIDGFGEVTAKDVQRLQPYYSFEDFLEKHGFIKGKSLRSKVRVNNVENLIIAGAFDDFGDRRDHLSRLYDVKVDKKKGKKIVPSEIDMILGFQETMGFFEQQIKRVRPGFSKYCITQSELEEYDPTSAIRVGGVITAISTIKTKKGEKMAFLTLEDMDEKIEITLFPSIYQDYKEFCHVGKIVEVIGIKSGYNDKKNCVEASEIIEK